MSLFFKALFVTAALVAGTALLLACENKTVRTADSAASDAAPVKAADSSDFAPAYAEALTAARRSGYFGDDSAASGDAVTRIRLACDVVYMSGFADSLKSFVPQNLFSDIEKKYQTAGAELAVSQGFVEAVGTSFYPDRPAAYSEICRALTEAAGYRGCADWCAKASEAGISAGIQAYKPDDAISCGAYAVMLENLAGAEPVMTVAAADGALSYLPLEGETVKGHLISHTSDEDGSILRLANDGWDIFDGSGYRYGPSMIINPDSSIDMWTASGSEGLSTEEIDWGRHRRSYDGGATWTAERVSVRPSPETQDWCWSCDPGVFRYGDWYYAFYTSILYTDGVNNNLFVCRSKTPDGSFDSKWCGDGWHSEADGAAFDPVPIVTYDGDVKNWGTGEGCAVVKDGVIYVYTTWTDGGGINSATRVYTAPAGDDWPAELNYRGSAFVPVKDEDSCDVKYIDAYGCFVAAATAARFTPQSYVILWVSYDGVTFRREQEIHKNLCTSIHNMGLAAGEDGHLDIYSPDYLAYSYQPDGASWGAWPTRFVPVTWLGGYGQGSESDLPHAASLMPVDAAHSPSAPSALGLFPNKRSLGVGASGSEHFAVRAYFFSADGGYKKENVTSAAEYTYDASLAEVNAADGSVRLLTGSPAWIYVSYGGMTSSIYVYSRYGGNEAEAFFCEEAECVIRFAGEVKQPDFILRTAEGKYRMLRGSEDGVTLSGWDPAVVNVDAATGKITPVAVGETSLTASYDGLTADLKIRVRIADKMNKDEKSLDLNQIRKQINEVDDGLKALFLQRLGLVDEVSEYKRSNHLNVENRSREAEIISRVTAGEDARTSVYLTSLYKTLFGLSKSREYETVGGASDPEILAALRSAADDLPRGAQVACQGTAGAYSQSACEKLFSQPNIIFTTNFEGVFSAVRNGLCRYGVLPVENNLYGSITEVYDLLDKYRFHIVRSVKLKVEQALLARPEVKLKDVRAIYSHPAAIGQCSQFLTSLSGVRVTPCANTAVAAKMVAQSNEPAAAIAQPSCAALYGLHILQPDIADSQENYTRFICISKELEIFRGADRVSLLCTVPNRPGALAALLSAYAANDINLVKLESRPIPGKDFEFRFYFDFETAPDSEQAARRYVSGDGYETVFLGAYREI